MGVRKNAKFLTAAEKERYVKACVLMKADIVNPGAPASAQYSKWDQYTAIHLMIQDAFSPSVPTGLNMGHGGPGAYSFLSWHRYFLYRIEKDLQSYVHVAGTPDLMLPYWDWSDPTAGATPLTADTFLGPSGDPANNHVVGRGYFAFNRPGAGGNPTPLPAWWPASLNGWRLPTMFGPVFQGGLRRHFSSAGALPPPNDIKVTLNINNYPDFQSTLEAGSAATTSIMHGAIHIWVGGTSGGSNCASMGAGHMTCARVSAFDPFFYLHHSNVDRLWAMWQMDGHQDDYPTTGGHAQHRRNDIMYPWTGGAPGYGTHDPIATQIPMPDFSALGAKRNGDTLDFRTAFGYTYDTIPIMGIGLDRTGSMSSMTPDPMTTGAPDVTKWEAAKRGVSAFLQDCETFQDSKTMYVMAGLKTFRSLPANDFAPVFPSPNYGLVKTGSTFSKATFESNVAAMTPGGSTPLADALINIHNTLVETPFSGLPTDEQRYLAMLTDGILTSGAPMSSIGDHTFGRTAIFAMGFGTGLDVDYGTIASIMAKGRTLSTQQIFHGENAGTIHKFFANSLAAAVGFQPIVDPVLELFEGEHTHLSFNATSADDAIYLTAQGMDFNDDNWAFALHSPNGQMLYGDMEGNMSGSSSHSGMSMCNDCCQTPDVTTRRSGGRLTIIIQRGSADYACWVGSWTLMIAYKAKQMNKMLMFELGELLFPVSAGPIRGERYARLLTKPALRTPTRNVIAQSLHPLDIRPTSTNSYDKPACNIAVNIYARTALQTSLSIDKPIFGQGEEITIRVMNDLLAGSIINQMGLARLIAPAFDLYDIIPKEVVIALIRINEQQKRSSKEDLKSLLEKYDKERIIELIRFDEKRNRLPHQLDFALLLARYEKEKKGIQFIKDQEAGVVSHDGSPLHIHYKDSAIKGTYHVGVVVEGLYDPNGEQQMDDGHGGHNMGDMHDMGGSDNHLMPTGDFESFSRILNISFTVE